jgi:hypothetical protein
VPVGTWRRLSGMDWETTCQRVGESLVFKSNRIIAGRWLNGFQSPAAPEVHLKDVSRAFKSGQGSWIVSKTF